MLTRRRGSELGNMIAITIGLVTTIVLGHLHVEMANLLAGSNVYRAPAWLPKVAFTWFALVGTVVVFIVGIFFTTSERQLVLAEEMAQRGQQDDRPMALRS
jgi:SSS family solute:Na+ symporter